VDFIGGGFIEPIPSPYTQISRFGERLTVGGLIPLGNLFSPIYVNHFIERAGVKITLASDPLTATMINDYKAGKLQNAPVSIQLISQADISVDHTENVERSLHNTDGAIVIELPIYDPATKKLTGHIDLLVQEIDGHLVVWDYKPHQGVPGTPGYKPWSPDPNTRTTLSFIQYIPQIASYALTLMHQLGLQGVTIGMYNHEGSWEMDPVRAMTTLNRDFPEAAFPWKDFDFLNLLDSSSWGAPDVNKFFLGAGGGGGFYYFPGADGGGGDFDFPFRLNNYYDPSLIQELKDSGADVKEIELTGLVRNRDGRIIWLERANFKHITDRHAKELKEMFGIESDARTVGNFILNAIKSYPIVNTYPGEGGQSTFYVYRILRSGQTLGYLHILVSSDGSIITAYPSPTDN